MISRPGGRVVNEDACGYWLSSPLACWVVCDGAGGHDGGAIAARTAVSSILRGFQTAPSCNGTTVRALLTAANHEVISRHAQSGSQMRATAAVLALDSSAALACWGHVGDTRIYSFRDRRMVSCTRDHSVVQSLVDAGCLAPDQLRRHPHRSTLLAALGEAECTPSFSPDALSVAARDAFLLCTDGVWEHVLEKELEAGLAVAGSAQQWVEAIEELVLQGAPPGHDNYSLIGVWLEESGDEP